MIIALVLLLIFLAGILLLTARVRRGQSVVLRPIPGFAASLQSIARSAEYGRPIHLSTGPRGAGDNTAGTAETLAGLNMTRALAEQCAATGAPVLVTTGDGLAFTLAENMVRAGYGEVGRVADAPVGPGASATQAAEQTSGPVQGVRMLAHRDALAYTAAATAIADGEPILNSTTIGAWGPEYLLLGESQQRHNIESVAGATSPEALAVMAVSARHTLVGEEIFAAGAYLQGRPAHLASLLTQDIVRWVVLALIIAGALLATIGLDLRGLLGISS